MNIINLPELNYEVFFVFIELGLIFGSLGVVFLTNIVYSAFLLGLVFVCISFLYLLLDADFVATAQILIYVGAVNILIVFAVMLINKPQSLQFLPSWTVGDTITLILCTSLFFLLISMILSISWSNIFSIAQSNKIGEQVLKSSVQGIGSSLLIDFLLPFELLSIVLLVALIGAITIARREKKVKLQKNRTLQVTKDSFIL
uniref:NAD(P)H-quinone oxidoreductase subunit 6, chloroplastic n=1 Tax=Anthoceros angustus TaxID=48387 RepID=NU6C_ANTAG|nr:RecName: Full=NAD(P)H-quinone oxidoreductase subunit 6, chloroplastic; AltName: Full=NAD(P)H dehydrogenase subunit 6; AltName: Full=NADH-plastoquinone oxidoreductase subunit 6 [Anthoceros angustus]BAC55404.1 NADH dehydrogenase ND6 subunit [Anthoceros angustus]BAC55504.1 NADH dehydrogenase ND6 subunit [Anthoceros angustus]